MSTDEYHRHSAIDLLTLLMCIPLCLWLGWVGIIPAFTIGWILNFWFSRDSDAADYVIKDSAQRGALEEKGQK